MFEIEFKKSVFKDFKKIQKKISNKILKSIEALRDNPYQGDIKKLTHSESYFRLRVGDYRVIFQIFREEKKIIIFYIRHRKDVYKNLL